MGYCKELLPGREICFWCTCVPSQSRYVRSKCTWTWGYMYLLGFHTVVSTEIEFARLNYGIGMRARTRRAPIG